MADTARDPCRGEENTRSDQQRSRCNGIIVPLALLRRRGKLWRRCPLGTRPIPRCGALCEASSSPGLADGGEVLDPMQEAEVFVGMPEPVGEKDVGCVEVSMPAFYRGVRPSCFGAVVSRGLADGLRKYHKQTDHDRPVRWLRRHAPTCEVRVAVTLGHVSGDSDGGVADADPAALLARGV